MNPIIKPLYELDAFNSLAEFVDKKSTPVLATGVLESQKSHLAYALSYKLNRPVFIITYSENSAKQIYGDLSFFMKQQVKYYPSKDIIFYNADVRSYEINKQRFEIINSLVQNENITIVLSVEAMLDKLTPKHIFNQYILEFTVGEEVNLDELVKKLISMGYERRDMVDLPGQFSVRGGILDIFTTTGDTAVRIEFWGDEIDSIRQFDTLSQRSVDTLNKLRIIPARETIYSEEAINHALSAIKTEFEITYNKYIKKNLEEQAHNLKENIYEILETLEEFHSFSKLDTFTGFFYEDCVSILDYLPSNSLIIFDEPKRISDNINLIMAEFEETFKNRIENGDILPSQINMVFSYEKILNQTGNFNIVLFSALSHRIKDFTIKQILNFEVRSASTFKNQIALLLDDLKYWVDNKYFIVILGGTKPRCIHIEEEIRNFDLPVVYFDVLEDINLQAGVIAITKGSLKKGFEYPFLKFVVITCDELFGEEKRRKKFKKKKSNSIESFTDLKVGDYIVHDNHGIGIYKGIERITQNGISRDYLKLQYADGGSIYVNTNQMNFVQKYIGNENIKLKLNKLSTSEWIRTKAKVKTSVKIIAKQLIELYSKRKAATGFTFSKDNIWQSEFEALFPHEETEDQLLAISDVKADMESSKVMDRLICGDVGYGKTEVAIRAAFKCVQDGKQVAFLVPTTILAQQHYNNFVERMKDFPVEIEMLSRFRTQKQQKESCLRIERGLSDIVVGTHRILSKTLKFKNLGLIIIDEEQRFGVGHKEKLKELRENVDVISLSATPIPRTLHMSLTGIRDMSLLEEPPLERHPVQTYVIEHNIEFIKKAIDREISRNGQVFYLSNRVRNISDVAMKIQNLIPDARVNYAHGQMSERELENIMLDFIDGNIDVLVCTTIIETGLDISNANTIIIQDADRMGLSQLYQLRGRVGRSNRLAYCYLTYRKNKVLTEVAEKRLKTIKDFTEFGSGFKIAMRDLEIRGAGNLLGGEQHGHMDTIGYDMYCKLLADAIKEEKGEIITDIFETSIDININAYIPAHYIKNEEQKLMIYKKISVITGNKDYYEIQEEIEDRYGDLPESVQNLLDIALLKAYATNLYITAVKQSGTNISFIFKENAGIDVNSIISVIEKNSNCLNFAVGTVPKLNYKITDKNALFNLKDVHCILKEILDNMEHV